ncbi:hypothetical protein HYX10_01295 [Candidatus Woesearchaeota archaeon]|nr:hypothetical protein [Candidatus Woesearchaeota archaeon]
MPQQGLFRRRAAPEPAPSQETAELVRRTRMLEERYSGLERRSQAVEENMIEHHRKLSSEIRMLGEELADVKKAVKDAGDKVQQIIAEMQELARQDEIQTIKKYLDYWEPMRFVTQQQVEKTVKEMMENNR